MMLLRTKRVHNETSKKYFMRISAFLFSNLTHEIMENCKTAAKFDKPTRLCFFEVGIIDKSAQMWELSINIEDLTLNSLHTGVSSGGQGCCPRLETPVSYEENLR